MRRAISIRTYAMIIAMGLTAGLLAAETYTITISVDNSGNISYTHKKGNQGGGPNGGKGHQIVQDGDSITWQCNSCQVFAKFKNANANPCINLTTIPCQVNTGMVPFGVYPYSIAVQYNNGTALTVDDPDVIVDNSSRTTGQEKKARQK